MKPPKKILIVGAGGIGCVLAPMLCRLANIVIMDKDNYEPGNAGRQFPALMSEGNKAQILADYLSPTTLNTVEHIADYFRDATAFNEDATRDVEMIFAAVDNNASRKVITEVAEAYGIPAILAGNEHAHGEAHLFLPEVHDPFKHFEFTFKEPPPWACNAPETLEEYPQTAIANQLAAGCAMHLYLSYLTAKKFENMVVYTRLDTFYSESKRARDFVNADPS
jgi:molybdopterin/thiamine biosynthesis adenylyltransferase